MLKCDSQAPQTCRVGLSGEGPIRTSSFLGSCAGESGSAGVGEPGWLMTKGILGNTVFGWQRGGPWTFRAPGPSGHLIAKDNQDMGLKLAGQ